MASLPDPSTISPEDLEAALAHYPLVISDISSLTSSGKAKSKPNDLTLLELDKYRLTELPDVIQQRRRTETKKGSGEGAYLTLDELEKLVLWKLRHGKFRPTLLGLVKSNSAAVAQETTRQAYQRLFRGTSDNDDSDMASSRSHASPSSDQILSALDILVSGLRGVGPATAALILSCADPENIPFFSDELAAWLLPGAGGGGKNLKYTRKEYAELISRSREVIERVSAGGAGWKGGASRLDMAAYSLIRGGAGGNDGKERQQAKTPAISASADASRSTTTTTSKDEDGESHGVKRNRQNVDGGSEQHVVGASALSNSSTQKNRVAGAAAAAADGENGSLRRSSRRRAA